MLVVINYHRVLYRIKIRETISLVQREISIACETTCERNSMEERARANFTIVIKPCSFLLHRSDSILLRPRRSTWRISTSVNASVCQCFINFARIGEGPGLFQDWSLRLKRVARGLERIQQDLAEEDFELGACRTNGLNFIFNTPWKLWN